MPTPSYERAPEEVRTDDDRFFQAIDETVTMPEGWSARDVAELCLCTLLSRVARGQAILFANTMPPRLREGVRACSQARTQDEPELFDKEEYLGRIQREVDISAEEAEVLSAAVFGAMWRHLRHKEIDDVESQLPPDLSRLWCSGRIEPLV